MRRRLLFLLGLFCLLLGAIGVVLPILPTTPFVLVAAFCFSRSSERFHRMLLNHRLFGSLIRNWEEYGVIPLKAKWISSTAMLVMISYPVFIKQLPLWADASMVVTVLLVMIYIWRKPSSPQKSELNGENLNR